MDKTVILTKSIIDLLCSEDWLTPKQREHYGFYENTKVSFSQIQKICPDETILDFIFNPKPLEFTGIQYIVKLQRYGEKFIRGTFDDIIVACNFKEKLQEESPNSIYIIEVEYKVKDK